MIRLGSWLCGATLSLGAWAQAQVTPVTAVKQDAAQVPAAVAPSSPVEPKTLKPVTAKKVARKSGKAPKAKSLSQNPGAFVARSSDTAYPSSLASRPRGFGIGSKLARASSAKKTNKATAVVKASQAAPNRAPAWVNEEEIATFDENTLFEKLVENRIKMARDPAAFTPQARVIAVRRELGLNDDESNNAPQDIVLNSGTDNGLDEGMVLSVSRSVPILDPYRDNQQKQLDVEFAKIKIIHVQKDLAIARLERIESIKGGLAVGTRAVLIGDYVGKLSR